MFVFFVLHAQDWFPASSWGTRLLDESALCGEKGRTMSVMAWRRSQPDEAKRAARGSVLGPNELSAARQAFEGAALVPGNLSTLRTLTDPERRPWLPRQPLSEEVIRDAACRAIRSGQ